MVTIMFVDGHEQYTKNSHVVSVGAGRDLHREVASDPVVAACEINKVFAPVTAKARGVAY